MTNRLHSLCTNSARLNLALLSYFLVPRLLNDFRLSLIGLLVVNIGSASVRDRGLAKCELYFIIRFLNAKTVAPSKFHHQSTEMYGEKSMDMKNIQKWCSEFSSERKNVYEWNLTSFGHNINFRKYYKEYHVF